MSFLKKKIAIVIYYHKDNKNSFNALIGALETDDIFNAVEIYFITRKEKLVRELEQIIQNYNKVIIGISLFTTQMLETRELIRILRKKYGNSLIIIAGGAHATGDPQGTLKMGFDIVVVGEGEETFIDLVKSIQNEKSLNHIKGIAYFNDNNEYSCIEKRPLINLDKYPSFPSKKVRFGAIEITRGCSHACYFCQTSRIFGARPRHRSIESICQHVQILADYYGESTDVRFITPNAFSYGSPDGKILNVSQIEKLLKKVREIVGEKGRIFFGTFPSECRPDNVTKESLELILTYASNDNIIIGAQSGSQRMLDSCHRGHTVEDVYHAVDLTLSSRLKVNVDFIFGLPDETKEDIRLTIEMMERLAKMGAKIHAHSFIPLPQTPYAKETVRPINRDLQESIRDLISKGYAFGQWKTQEKLAFKISKYLKSKKLR